MEHINKKIIADICEELYKYCINQIPQIENGKLIWILNGSTLCNLLYNVASIDGKSVSEEFNESCFEFIRQPKGDIDITYIADRPYKFDLKSKEIMNFQFISEEQRTYNFVDSNSELDDNDLKQICKMTTKKGFSFYAKKPQYIFLYKFIEFVTIFNKEILSNDLNSILVEKKNIINDLNSLYKIAVNYCGKEELKNTIESLPNISGYLHELYENNNEMYTELIINGLNIINADQEKLRK